MTTPTRPEKPVAAEQATPAPEDPTDAFAIPPRPELDLPAQFGRYAIVRPLGQGGMGRVYLARDNELGRLVALKVPQLERGERSLVRERFYREARAAAMLHHPNICPIYDIGCVEEVPYLTMAYIDGPPLHEWARTSEVTLATVLSLVARMALALDEAHAHGVIHRDLKPSNVMLDRRGEPVIMDFGLARRALVDEDRLTSPGLLMGTPAYMPPEAVLGQCEPSPAGDIYSLGVMLYELITGRCPFVGPITAILAQIATEPPPPPSRFRPALDPRLDAICLKALARKPDDRYARMADLAQALLELPVEGGSTIRRPVETTDSAPTRITSPDPKLAPRILDMLRKWGWARAVQKMRNKAQRADSESQRRGWQGFLDWMAGQRTDEASAVEALSGLPEGKALRGWALVGQASHLLRDRDHNGSRMKLEKAERDGDAADVQLQATIAHTRGAVLVHQGLCDDALPHLHRALDLFGREHFVTGRVLDTLGMAYAYKGNLPVAKQFYEQSILYKQRFDDEAGIAISQGQLGRLYLGWGELDLAEEHFQHDLRLVQKLRSRWSEAQIYNHLGQVAIARAERDLGANRKLGARRHLSTAAGWLDESIRLCIEGTFPVSEAFSRKDRAIVRMLEGDLDAADEQVRQATTIFAAEHFAEGVAKAALVEGMILRRRGKWADAERKFRQALNHFEATQEADEIIATYREIARARRDSGAATPLVTRAFAEALAKAEAFRHDPLVRDIEQELHEVDVEAYLRHVYQRARGQGIDEDSPSLMEASNEVATVLFIDLPGFTDFAQGLDPHAVLVTFNHLMADFAAVLQKREAAVLAYRGSGLMALAREARHAERAVNAALDLVAALEEFNRPRRLLGLPCFSARIGIASGDMLLGNVGTYQKMDFSAIGTTVNLAGALRNEARPGVPLISRGTYELVRERFGYHDGPPRAVPVAGLGSVEVWEVVSRKGGQATG